VVPQAGAPPEESLDGVAPGGPARPGIALDRLLELAWLTPAQTVLVGALALEQAAGGAAGRLDAGSVRVTASGDVLLDGAAPEASVDGSARQLLDLLRRNAHRRARHPPAADEYLLHGLESVTGDAGSCARQLRSLLAAHGCDPGRLAGQVGALVGQARIGAVPASAEPAGAGVPVRVPDHRSPAHRTRHGHLVAAIVTACAVLLLTAGYFTVNGQMTPFLHRLLGTGGPTASVTRPGSRQQATGHQHLARHQHAHHRARPHHPFGPPSAGAVHHVSLQPNGCAAGAACAVRVTVSTSPATSGEAVSWRVGVTDRCTRHTTWSAPASVTAQPGWTSVFATSTVTLPRLHRAALVARTSAPAHAASQPVPLPGGHC
jgi:hypothetical protein